MTDFMNPYLALEANMTVLLQKKMRPLEAGFIQMSHVMSPETILSVWIPLLGAFDAVFLIDGLVMFATGSFMTTMLKWFIPGDRPYWWVKETSFYKNRTISRPLITVFENTCDTTSGTISTHCTIFTIFLLILCEMLSNLFTSDKSEKPNKFGGYSIALIGSVAMWMSRVFLAAHFLHQCVLGSILGAFIYYFYKSNDNFEDITIYAEKKEAILFATFAGVIFGAFYGGALLLNLDPQWSVKLAFKWCGNADYLKPSTTPFYAIVRDLSIIFGLALASPLASKKYRLMSNIFGIIISVIAIALFYGIGELIPTGSGRCPYFSCVFFRHSIFVFILAYVLPTYGTQRC